jgi:hypothetical protein
MPNDQGLLRRGVSVDPAQDRANCHCLYIGGNYEYQHLRRAGTGGRKKVLRTLGDSVTRRRPLQGPPDP